MQRHHRRKTPRKETAELLRLAFELDERDRQAIERKEERRQWIAAAEEAGVPADCLARAAALLQTRRTARIRRWRNGAVAAMGMALALLSGWGITHRRAREAVGATAPGVVYANDFARGAGGG